MVKNLVIILLSSISSFGDCTESYRSLIRDKEHNYKNLIAGGNAAATLAAALVATVYLPLAIIGGGMSTTSVNSIASSEMKQKEDLQKVLHLIKEAKNGVGLTINRAFNDFQFQIDTVYYGYKRQRLKSRFIESILDYNERKLFCLEDNLYSYKEVIEFLAQNVGLSE